jgi:hypothetical protein
MPEKPRTQTPLEETAAPAASTVPGALSPRAQAAGALVGALAKSARAFTLYDPGNALVRQFIADYQARAEAATAGGEVALEVRPFELGLGREVVYQEEDRERSLAFKLFRDGVRKLTFSRGVRGDELMRLLEIVAVRFVGVRQAEDDLVTLLRKADLRTIGFSAVEGYASDDEAPELGLRPRGGEPPAGFDTPLPRLPAPGPISYIPVPEEALAALHAEEATEALAQAGLRLAAELVAWAARGAIPGGEVTQFCAELRDYLLADQQLGALALLADLAGRQPAGPLRDEILRGLADPRLLEAVLGALPEGGAALPAEAARLVPFVPAAAVLERIATEESPGRRSALLSVLAARLPADAETVTARLPTLPTELARVLLRTLSQRAPDQVDEASVAMLGHPDPALQLDALRAIAGFSRKIPAAPLLKLLGAPEEPVRVAAAQALEQHGDGAAARAVAEALSGRKGLSRAEAAALGRTLGVLHAGAALRLFDGWLVQKRRLLGALRVSEQEEALRWAAVAGLGAIPGAEAEQRLEAVAKWADEGLRRHLLATLGRRRAEDRRNG